ncbi:MAG: hypothetical protein WAO83_03425 [Fuerstiella sp.]
MSSSAQNQLFRLARIAALIAACLVISGPIVHTHEHGEGCCSSVCSDTPAKPVTKPCPFGCSHHGTHDSAPEDEDSNSEHDQHHCAVCSVLAQASSCPVILGMPQQLQDVVAIVSQHSDSAIVGTILETDARGPPANA